MLHKVEAKNNEKNVLKHAELILKVDLFDNERDGFVSVRIPAIVVTPQNSILAFAVGRTRVSDWSASKILLRRSSDGGSTWTPTMVVAEMEGAIIDNPVAIVDEASRCVHLLYQADYKRCYYTRTDDEGASFAPAVDITATFDAFRSEYEWTVLAPGPGHGIKLANGRLLVPVWMANGVGKAHRPSCVSVVFSDDAGRTWQRGEIAVHNSESTPNPSETVATQLADGTVLLNVRTESPRNLRAVTYSKDGATNWSPVEFIDDLYEPVCCAGLVRIEGATTNGEYVLAFSNPAGQPGETITNPVCRPRTNLTIRLSFDGGRTWPTARLLEHGITGYSDLAADESGKLYCLYEWGSASEKNLHPRGIRFARISQDWVATGQ